MGITERRRYDRLLCAGLVEVRWSDEHGFPCEAVANLDDVSPGGACLLVDCRIPPGTRIAVGHLICQVEAETRYCRPSELGWVVGAQFLTGKTPGIRACSPEHCVDPKTIPADVAPSDEHRLSPEVRSTIGCMTLYEAVRNKEW